MIDSKLIYICENDLSQQIGGTIHVKEVLHSLSKLHHDIILIAPDYHHNGSVEKNIEHKQKILIKTARIRIIKWLYFYFKSTLKIFQEYKNNKNIIVYSREMPYNIFLPILIKMYNIPFFIELNGVLLKEMEDLGYSKLSYSITKFVERYILKSTNVIISVSEEIKSSITDLLYITSEKIKVIPNGTDINKFKPLERLECRRSLNIDTEKFIVGFIGSCYPYHDIDTLISALPELIKIIPNIHVFIVGDGFMLEKWKELSKHNSTEKYITFTGYIPFLKANDYINSFDVCFASYKKGTSVFPMKNIDYLACNKPIITSNIPAISKFFSESEFFKMIEPENKEALTNAIMDLYNKRNEPVTGHRQMVIDNYTWDHTAQKIMRVIKDCC